MPLPRRRIREIQKMNTPEFRRFLNRFGNNMQEGAYSRGYQEGSSSSQDIEEVLESALKNVKGYGPVLHGRMVEFLKELEGGK